MLCASIGRSCLLRGRGGLRADPGHMRRFLGLHERRYLLHVRASGCDKRTARRYVRVMFGNLRRRARLLSAVPLG
jgi:hypothetical protein